MEASRVTMAAPGNPLLKVAIQGRWGIAGDGPRHVLGGLVDEAWQSTKRADAEDSARIWDQRKSSLWSRPCCCSLLLRLLALVACIRHGQLTPGRRLVFCS